MLAPNAPNRVSSQAMTIPPVTVRNLSVAYAGRTALRGVDWDAPQSGLVAIVGPNGAGKSTLLKAILGLVPKASGTVTIFGEPVESQRGKLAYVPQRASVDWDFPATAIDVVAMGLYRSIGWLKPVRAKDRAKALSYLEAVRLGDLAERQIGALSGGQQQRVFLARALAQNAKLFLLDEPFAGVDAVTEGVMTDVFHKLRADGALVVCVHHDLGNVPEIFDHVLLLNRSVVASGPVTTTFVPELIARAYGVPIALDDAGIKLRHD
jgi:manganese/zinc/iron transport system ATP- binding protein